MSNFSTLLSKYYSFFKVIVWIAIGNVIALFGYFVYIFAYNFPFYDDYDNLILFLSEYIKSDGISRKIMLLFEQNFEHRVIFAKVLTLLYYKITGEIDIKGLIMLGDLSLIGVFIFFVLLKRDKKLSLLSLFAIACVLFQLQHYEDSISWATCSLQHAPCIFFSLWSFYLAIFRKKFPLSAILAVLALFTSANGMMTILIWLIIFYSSAKLSLSRIGLSLAVISITLIHLMTLKMYSGSVLGNFTSNFFPKCILLISFAGQLADSKVVGHEAPCIILGTLFLFPFVIAAIKLALGKGKDISQLQWFCLAGLTSVLFVGFLITFARGTEPDHFGFKLDRYKIYSAFFGVFAIGFYDQYWNHLFLGKLVRLSLASIAFVFCLSSYYLYADKTENYRNDIMTNQINYAWNKSTYFPIVFRNNLSASDFDFCLRTFFFPKPDPVEKSVKSIEWEKVTKLINVSKSDDNKVLKLKNTDLKMDTGSGISRLFVVATATDQEQPKYIFPVNNTYKRSFRHFYTSFRKIPMDGFDVTIFKEKIENADYKLHLVYFVNNKIVDVYNIGSMHVSR
ncbi:hypothetical protein [Dyadobacter sp. CY356]|uniref:hypothetical protein n=1 Tax=Dyadobacter sp. CY356 TaxID=2906442 RepID=UPI001F1CE6EA|nr:hypothetical protein [Dyadobacter sp. CY356]MCF0058459.1 hypothetical protein [Dyadobacter sp. CY356]